MNKLSKLLFATSIVVFSGMSGLNAQNWKWAKAVQSSGADVGNAISADGLGNIYTTGYISENVTVGSFSITHSGSAAIFAAKYDTAGNVLWAKKIGGANAFGYDIVADAMGNVYISGVFTGSANFEVTTLTSFGVWDAFIAKLDPSNGDVLWAKSGGGGGYDAFNELEIDHSGNVVAAGYFEGSATFGLTPLTSAGSWDVVLAKFDAMGNQTWVKKYGGSGDDRGEAVAIDEIDNIVVVGYFGGTANFDSYMISSNSGSRDIFVMKTGSNGLVMWAKGYGSEFEDNGLGAATDVYGNVYATGYFQGTCNFGGTILNSNSGSWDMFLLKTNTDGTTEWALSGGSTSNDLGNEIETDAFGNLFVVGRVAGFSTFGSITYTTNANSWDAFVTKYDNYGYPVYSVSGGGPGEDYGHAVAIDNDGSVYFAGYFNGTTQFGANSFANAGGWDYLIAKIAEPCTPPFVDYIDPFAGCVGTSASIYASAMGTNLNYQWKKDGMDVGGNSPSYYVSNSTLSDTGNYYVIVSNACGADTSEIAFLDIDTGMTITAHPQSVTIAEGGDLILSVGVESPSEPSFQWYHNGSMVPEGYFQELYLYDITPSQAGEYYVEIYSACGADLTSNTAIITVAPPPVKLHIRRF